MPNPTRSEVAAHLWQVAEHNIIAEWICCDPIDPKHQLCVKGDATLKMTKALLVDSPDAWKPAPLLDAVMEQLAAAPPTADRAAVLLWAADQIDAETRQLKADEVLETDKFRPCRDASAQLRRLAVNEPTAEPHPPHDSWLVEWRADGGDWAVVYPTHDHSKALGRLARGRQDAPDWQWRLVRETATYAVEEEQHD